MNFAIISGSHRINAQSLKVARYIESTLRRSFPGAEPSLISLSGNPLPLWDEESGGAPDDLWNPIAEILRKADALVVISPEWNGMATSGIKNFLHLCSNDEVGHKPALIVTVSASRGGAYPVAELRMTGGKNNRLCFIPEHVIVRNVENVLNDPKPPEGHREDAYIRRRIDYALRILEKYGDALRLVRESGVIDHENFGNGM